MAAAGELEIGLVEGRLLDVGRVGVEDAEKALGEGLVDLVVAADKDALGAELVALAEGHAGVDAELAGLVGAGRGHAPLVGQAADDDRLALEGRVEQDLDGREKGVDVDVDDVPAIHIMLRSATSRACPRGGPSPLLGRAYLSLLFS